MQELKDYFNKLDRLGAVIDKLPKRMAVEAVKFTKERFVQQNWVDARTENWKKRKLGDTGRAVLVGKGTARLKKSIRIIKVGKQHAVIGSELEYAQIHNEGGRIKVTPKMKRFFWAQYYKTKKAFWKNMALSKKKYIVIPQRKFLGESSVLGKRMERMALLDFTKALK